MPVLPCLAYLLDTPGEPGVVVTHRCSRPAGHPDPLHQDGPTGIRWEDPTAGVVWADGARASAIAWADLAADPPAPAGVPPMPGTPAPIDPDPAGKPWARVRADAIAARAATTTDHPNQLRS